MVEETFLRLLAKATGSTVTVPRGQPLTLIRGIPSAVEERLSEEGIFDVVSLAMADPAKTYRNTSYELRQILSWIDQALLIYYLPQNWQQLENEGITGAMDLAWHHPDIGDKKRAMPPGGVTSINIDNAGSKYKDAPTVTFENDPADKTGKGAAATTTIKDGEVKTIEITSAGTGYTHAPKATLSAPPDGGKRATATAAIAARAPSSPSAVSSEITALANRVNMNPALLCQVIERIFGDAQVQLVWAMYQRWSDEESATSAKESESSAEVSETSAKESEASAEESEASAEESETSAKKSETSAKVSETSTKESETSAEESPQSEMNKSPKP
jgi:hypothetical protein